MARPLSYTPPTPPDRGASDEVDDLVAALHESGLLRALAGGARAYPDILRLGLRSVQPSTLRAVIALGHAVTDLDPEAAERLAAGLRSGRRRAGEASRGAPPGPVALWRRLRDPDTRRGISAVLALLAAVGGALGERDAPDEEDVAPGPRAHRKDGAPA